MNFLLWCCQSPSSLFFSAHGKLSVPDKKKAYWWSYSNGADILKLVYGSFCSCSDKHRWKQVWKKALIWLTFESTVYHVEEGMMAGTLEGLSHCICDQEQRDKCWFSAWFLLFIQFRILTLGMLLPTLNMALPTSVTPFWIHSHRHNQRCDSTVWSVS